MQIERLWDILADDPLSLRWRMHGIGFIKAYVDEERTQRVNIYNKRFLTPNITIHHDHPWHLMSRILAGELTNTRYARTAYGNDFFWEGVINCANYKGVEGHPRLVKLWEVYTEKLPAGTAYVQSAREIHATEAIDGTVTLMDRIPYHGGDGTARVFWPRDGEYVNADIHELSEGEIIHAVSVALRNRPDAN